MASNIPVLNLQDYLSDDENRRPVCKEPEKHPGYYFLN